MGRHHSKTLFSCQRDGLKICGHEFRPVKQGTTDNKSLPAVILSHGFMSSGCSNWKYAKFFSGMGYIAYTFDFNGGGPKSKSEGRTTDMSVFTEVEDLKAVISYVREREYVDTEKIILMGFSQGGFVSAIVASQLREQINRLILFFPALCIPDDARAGNMLRAKFNPKDIPEVFQCGSMKLGSIYAKSVQDKDAYELIRSYEGPVCIIHGTADSVVDVSYSKKAQTVYKNCSLSLIDAGNHGFHGKDDAVAKSMVKAFMDGNKEILSVDVHLTDRIVTKKKGVVHVSLPFEGASESFYFKGKILPGASDEQEHKPLSREHYCCADYSLKGNDYMGVQCHLHIINKYDGNEWEPTVTTDSKALGFLEQTKCCAILQHRKKGPVVHIFTKEHE